MKGAGQHDLKDAKAGRKCSKTHSLFSSPARLCVIKQVFLHRRCSISSNTGTSPLLCLSQRRTSLQKRSNFVSCDKVFHGRLVAIEKRCYETCPRFGVELWRLSVLVLQPLFHCGAPIERGER